MKGDTEKKFDTRLVERHLDDGTAMKKELNEHLHKLRDLSSEADWVSYPDEAMKGMKPMSTP